MNRSKGLLLLFFVGLLTISLGRVPAAEAGVFNADTEVTYKEYWMPHKQFTGGCTADLVNERPNGNSWYAEPDTMAKCPKTMLLSIPDNISGALKAELYVDLWRNYDTRSARLRINNQAKVYESPVGYDWSRTPWIEEIPLDELIPSANNSFLFWGASGKYHIHDVALRVYYDDENPIIPAGSSDVTAPTGELLTLKSDDPLYSSDPPIDVDTGGLLYVDNNQIKLTASVSPDAALVEFHAYYDGYDEDNDGETREWHNVLRHNWSPGGVTTGGNEMPNGQYNATINHIGTVKAPQSGGEVEIIWNLPHVINQSGVRFKIRVIDAAGNARDAAGGVSAPFTLVRSYPVIYYTMPNFDDFGLHMSQQRPDFVDYTFPLPANFNPAQFQEAMLLGMYWRQPKVRINGSSSINVNPGSDPWDLGIANISPSLLQAGNNNIRFEYGGGQGNFIEHPGPMIVLRGQKGGADTSPPIVASTTPANNSTNVNSFQPIIINLTDNAVGIDFDTILMMVDGQFVDPVRSNSSTNLTLTYTPSGPYEPLEVVPVTITACDLVGNCMDKAYEFSFTVEPKDTTPPIISNVNALTTESTATITWHTNEGADSLVEYGTTIPYEKAPVSATNLVTQHSLELVGLTPDTVYNFRVSSTDFWDNTATTTNLTFTTKRPAAGIISDNFSGCTLDTSVWSYINPKNDSVLALTGSGARISVPAGTSNQDGHDIWQSGLYAPRLMQNVANPEVFEVEIKFDATLNQRIQTMGLLVQQDNANWLRFNIQNDGGPQSTIRIADSVNGKASTLFTTDPPVTLTSSSYMRVQRLGPLWILSYSTDGTNWTSVAPVERALNVSQLGPFVGNSGNNPAFVGTIDYFENRAAPLGGGDAPITLTIEKVGVGEVNRTPAKDSYLCGETVTLSASATAPWSFESWSGAITSANATETITLNKSETVVANFSNPTLYTLAVDVVSNGDGVGGTVTQDPPQQTYLYGTEVTLTAVPTPGWSFVGWEGDITGTDPVTPVTITGDMAITAIFEEDAYTLTAFVVSEGVGGGGEEGGTITVDPVQDTYRYGEQVTLSASVNAGWSFAGWDINDEINTNPTVTLTMEEDVIAAARMVQNQYNLNITIINDGETEEPNNGILIDPPGQTGYGHGQTVTLTASPDQGWQFTGWGGDLSGTEPTKTVVFTEDMDVEATFVQDQYTLTVTVDDETMGSVVIEPVKEYYLFNDPVMVKPVAKQGYEFVLWTGDVTGNADPLILAMQKDMTIEAIFDIDQTPIEIVSHSVEVHGLIAIIRWTTDVPGSSQVDYGLDTFYEEGSERKDELVTQHSIQLKSLQPDMRYHYQITSVDEFGNTVRSDDLTFFTGTSSGLVSDDFSSCQLQDTLWTFVNPLNDSSSVDVTGQQVEIFVSADDPDNIHNIYTNGMDVPRLMQASNDRDFTIEAKFDSVLTAGNTIQGIVVEQDANNFIRFDFFFRTYPNNFPTPEIVVYAQTFTNLQQGTANNKVRFGAVNGPMWMRIVRAGDVWQQWYSLDGQAWTMSYEFTHDMEVKKVGLFGGNTKERGVLSAHTVVVDYFFNTAARIEPEDSFYQLTFSQTGSGMVQRNPDKTGYYCGEQVTLTAVGNPGWSFVEWGGDIAGTNPVHTITVDKHMTIEVQFQLGAVKRQLMLPIVMKN